jgi:hypothetical protein
MSESNSKTDSNDSTKTNNRTTKPEIQRYSVAKGKYSARLNTDRPSSGIYIDIFFCFEITNKIFFKVIQKIPIIKINIIIMIHLIMIMINIIINKNPNEELLNPK